ncbi:GNAT family N-acetyltransferase [Tessaracoccus sp. HDW20]|uniref:GNAT family N-acetyltransferase n=1 Tax=Tessaracoccus coleopterorum TaxID=2714950 RepID=UPI0018D47977|nr:GNAT family protein [Tessaracoccus coleopterorum]NHB83784.1 GNAT family N-acetyltransferase [Tessaracoccus coleopterorum]
MRAMICAFAFDQLGAVQCRTEAYADNPASQRVSEKVGYERFDRAPVDRLGEATDEVRFRLTPARLNRPDERVNYQGADAFRAFVGLA